MTILELTLDERVERYLEVAHQGIIPNTTSPRRRLWIRCGCVVRTVCGDPGVQSALR